MTGDDIASFVFYGVLLAGVAGSFLLSRTRHDWPSTVRNALIWVGIFLAVVLVYAQVESFS